MTDHATCRILIDGVEHEVHVAATVAAVLVNAGLALRKSVSGEPREVLCGMGVCHECRVRINGRAQQRACMTIVRQGMVIERDV